MYKQPNSQSESDSFIRVPFVVACLCVGYHLSKDTERGRENEKERKKRVHVGLREKKECRGD